MRLIAIDLNLEKENLEDLLPKSSSSALSMEEVHTLMQMIQTFKELVEVKSSGKMLLTNIMANIQA